MPVHYKHETVNVLKENKDCLLEISHQTHKYIAREVPWILYVKADGIHSNRWIQKS
jgi:hypothetical protein